MVTYKLKVMKVEYVILKVSHIIQNRNDYHSDHNNCGNDYIMVLLYDEHLCDTIIYENTDIGENKILERIDLVLSYLHIVLHICDAKYRI